MERQRGGDGFFQTKAKCMVSIEGTYAMYIRKVKVVLSDRAFSLRLLLLLGAVSPSPNQSAHIICGHTLLLLLCSH